MRTMTNLEKLMNYSPEHKQAWEDAQRERREAVPTPAQIGGRVPLEGSKWQKNKK